MQTQPSSYRARFKSIGFMGLVISPAVILVSVDPRWDGVLFLAIYTGLSAWVVQILNSDKQNK